MGLENLPNFDKVTSASEGTMEDTDEIRAAILRNIANTANQLEKWKSVLKTYDEAKQSHFEPEMVKTRFPQSKPTSMRQYGLQGEIRTAVANIPEGQEFTLSDVFNLFPTKGLDYEKARPSISIFLSELAKKGSLEKIKRGTYVVKIRTNEE